MKRETIYMIQKPVSKETDSTNAAPGDDFGDKILEVIEGAADGVCDVIEVVTYEVLDVFNGVCDVVCDFFDNLTLSIMSAG